MKFLGHYKIFVQKTSYALEARVKFRMAVVFQQKMLQLQLWQDTFILLLNDRYI